MANPKKDPREFFKPRGMLEHTHIPSKTHNLTCAIVTQSAPRLYQVEYPGFVENPERALRTMGGIYKLGQTFENPKKRLEVRFRPGDLYCNPAYGDPNVTCGLLIKLRRRKSCQSKVQEPDKPPPPPLIDLSSLPPNEAENTEKADDLNLPGLILNTSCGNQKADTFSSFGANILAEEQKFLEELELKRRVKRSLEEGSIFIPKPKMKGGLSSSDYRNRLYIGVPEDVDEIRAPKSDFHVEVLGISPRCYKFKGMCDFQYLPMETVQNGHESILNDILPIFPDPDIPDITLDDLTLDLVSETKETTTFLVPAIMSRIDKPPDGIDRYYDEVNTEEDPNPEKLLTLSSTRTKRIVYSHLCNFKVTDTQVLTSEPLVPVTPINEAIGDATKRGLTGPQLDTMQQLFQSRPVWTRLAVESASGFTPFSLKYLLPCVAYFALNGPWRSCWIRLGFDPRRDKSAYLYQLIDYRLPSAYRSLLDRRKGAPPPETDKENYFSFKPDAIPPKCQMIYQFCEIQLDEIADLIQILQSRVDKNEDMPYDIRCGFLTEDMMEFIRYSISRHIEIFLFHNGRIRSVTLPAIPIPQDGVVSKEAIIKAIAAKDSIKTRLRPRPPPRQIEEDEMSNHSSTVGDLKVTEDFVEEEDEESVSEEEDENERIMNEALEATSARPESGGDDSSDDEEDERMDRTKMEDDREADDVDLDHFLGLVGS